MPALASLGGVDFLRGYFNGITYALTRWGNMVAELEANLAQAKAASESAEVPAVGTPYGGNDVEESSESQ